MTEKVSQFLRKGLPVTGQLQTASPGSVKRDLIAAITVTVLLVPQAMAYAMLAGLSPVVGLYASTLPLAVYALLGTSRYLAVGPVAMVSLLVYDSISRLAEPGTAIFHYYALTLALMVGLIQIILGLFKAGFIVNYFSKAVITGFTSAAAIIIAISQIPHVTGQSLPDTSSTFDRLHAILMNSDLINGPTLIIGVCALAILIVSKRFLPKFPIAITVVVAATIAARIFHLDEQGVQLVGAVPRGLPEFQWPTFNFQSMKNLLSAALAITLIGYMESYAIAQSFATRNTQTIDPDRELTALGTANLVSGLFSGYPVTGGLSRTAVNFTAGARTALAGLFTACLMILTLLFLTPLFTWLPRAILAAIIIAAASSLLDFREFLHLSHIKIGDGLSCFATFGLTLIAGVEWGILFGVILSLGMFIRRSANPHMAELGYCQERDAFLNIKRFPMVRRFPGVLVLRIDASLFFANTGFVSTQTRYRIEETPNARLVIFDCEGVNDIDAVAVGMLEKLIEDYDSRQIDFAFARLKGPVRDVLTRADWHQKYPQAIRFRSVRQVFEELEISPETGYTGDSIRP